MNPPPVIREAKPEDDAAVGEILVSAFAAAYAAKMPHFGPMSPERERDLRAVAKKREAATVLVAELGGKVVGTVALFRPGAPGSQAWLPGAADLRHLATDPALHGRGLSHPLLDEAEQIARGWSVEAICVHVRRGVRGVSELYQRRGYLRAPEGDREKPDASLEAYVLRLKG